MWKGDESVKCIEASHERCKLMGIKTENVYSSKIIEDEALEKKMELNKELMLIATPFLNHLNGFVKNSNFFAILTDAEGCILSIVGNDKIMSEADKLKMIPGAYMDEEHIGTNAMSIALSEGVPVQLSGREHYIMAYNKWTCSAAPIKDSKENVIGIIDLTGYNENVHPHTLGMVIAAASAIESMLEINQYNLMPENSKKGRRLSEKILNNQTSYTFDKIIGKDKNFIKVIEYAKKVSNSKSTVLITGESGTGKEVFAQSIHNYSIRREEPFIAVNCGAIPGSLIESELFGYEEGAFTGAKKGGNAGKFEIADGGTIFLDEIGEMPVDMQVRLLRVIEEGVITRIGSSKQISVNVRIIAATNKDLMQEIEKGNFRKDLFYRLNVIPIKLPALRERKEDIPLLVDYYMSKIAKRLNKHCVYIPKEYMKYLENYDWPGNIRELENVIELIVNTETIQLSLSNCYGEEEVNSVERNLYLSLDQVEKQHIMIVLKAVKGNITIAAKVLEIGRNTLYRKIEKYNIDCSQFEQYPEMKNAQ